MLSLALVAACSSSQKTAPASLVRVDPEPRGANCAAGGTVVRTGVDRNDDGVLQDDEIASTSYVCVGGASLVRVDPEPVGTSCAAGGTAVRTGADANGDGVLQDGEVSSTRYLCSGTSSLVRLDPEPAGTSCAAGGTAVRTGRDANADGILQDGEVSATEYVCGIPSAFATRWAANPPGTFGGTAVQGVWVPVGREATLLKTNARSRLRVTVSDNLRVGFGVQPSQGSYAVRMNGGDIGCTVSQYEGTGTASTAQNIHFPLADVCLTDPLPPGLYRFDSWATSDGTGAVGWSTPRPVLLVEEFDGDYAATTFGPEFVTTSTALVQAAGRSVKYTKKVDATILKVTYADTLRVGYRQDPGEGYVMVRRNGVDTPCAIGKKDGQGTTGNFQDPFVVTCILAGVGAGDHEFSVWARAAKWGGTDVGQLYLGWSRSPLLLVEELPATSPTRSYAIPASVTGEVSGAWSAVTDRQVLHTVTAPGKTLKITYSDTFGGALGPCNAAPSFFQLYVDGAPTGCMNNMFVDVGSNLPQAHHHPINHTCLVPGLAPGQHAFAIYHTNMNINAQTPTSCGTNMFGFGRGQAALIVEELP